MVKVEKVPSGFIVEMNGESGQLVNEIAQAAAAFHVKAFDEMQVDKKDEADCRKAITAAVTIFGMLMTEAMEKQLGIFKGESALDRAYSLIAQEGGAVQ